LCLLCFCVEFQPSEPFLTVYMKDVKNLTEAQIDNDVYPWWTWAYLALMLPVGASVWVCASGGAGVRGGV
jgi:thiamine transporter 2/3